MFIVQYLINKQDSQQHSTQSPKHAVYIGRRTLVSRSIREQSTALRTVDEVESILHFDTTFVL